MHFVTDFARQKIRNLRMPGGFRHLPRRQTIGG
jgi:hypothetical protein